MSRMVVVDSEGDGLYPSVIWCAVAYDYFSDEWKEFTPKNMNEFKPYIESCEYVVFHNGLGYDRPHWLRLLDINIPLEKCIDTVVLSRLLNSARPAHSVEYYGKLFGKHKVEHEDWSQYSEEMLHRCRRDTELQVDIFNYLLKVQRQQGLPKEVSRSEHRIAEICQQINEDGFEFKEREAHNLLLTLHKRKEELDKELLQTFVSLPKFISEVTPKYKKDGNLSSVGLKFLDNFTDIVVGDFSRIDFPPVNLNSQDFLIKHLMKLGWKPTEFTDKGNPKLTEWVLEDAAKKYPEAKLLNEWDLVDRRITMVGSWLDAIGKDGRIHGSIFHIGTWTHRMSHSKPNLAQVPASDKPYGHDCRSLFTVRPGYKLVGTDASGIQLRVLAHYMNDEEYTYEVVHGDIHTKNQIAAGFDERSQSKTFIYAFLLGAGNKKIGEIAGADAKKGKKLKEQFLKNTPALASAKSKYEMLAARGYLIGLDGRRIPVSDPYYTLACLLQSGETIIMRTAAILWTRWANEAGIDYKICGWIHDEWQTEVKEEQAEELGKLQVKAIQQAGKDLHLNCSMDGEYSVGNNWSETH